MQLLKYAYAKHLGKTRSIEVNICLPQSKNICKVEQSQGSSTEVNICLPQSINVWRSKQLVEK